jgi:hypothetical protein
MLLTKMAKTDFASESGHWYTQDGEPMYTVPKAKGGGLRATTLRDARKLNLVPSVTTVMKELAAPQLEMWKIKQAVTFSKKMRKRSGETDDQFAMRAYYKSQEQVRERAEGGSLIHGALESAFLGESYLDDFTPYVTGVRASLAELGIGDEDWSAEKSFSKDGFGGKVDLHSPNFVVDFKTKEFDEFKLPVCYDNHFMQLGAYRAGLGLPLHTPGMILFVSVNDPGFVHAVTIEPPLLTKGYEMFRGLLHVWQAKRGYYPT